MSIKSGNGNLGYLYECRGTKTIDEFKKCILQKSVPYIRYISLKSYKQATHLNHYTSYQSIIPKDGYLPTLNLDPLYSYVFCLFDKDFLLYVSNPLIVQRSCITVSANSSFVGITLKVGKFERKIILKVF